MENRSWVRWGVVLGFALGGFFDGILLHQILQWHHLLSLVPGMADLRTQVLWDGYFHALMYVIAVAALFGLWRARSGGREARDRSLVAAAFIGFGIWHVVDSVLSHWILGIHRVRLDSPNPLMWDLIWIAAFGIVPLIIGRLLLGRGPPSSPRGHSPTLALLIAGFLTTGAAAWSLQAPPGQRFTTIVFRPGTTPQQVMSAVLAADARLVWADAGTAVIVIDVPKANRFRFYKHGALLVSGSGLPSGCFNWSKAYS
jgi:uncharacterized membrane protein